mgnify:CR=1 FL=1
MFSTWRESLQPAGFGGAQVHINSSRPGADTDCRRGGISTLAFTADEVFQRLLIKDQQGSLAPMPGLDRTAVANAGAYAGCNFAGDGIESDVELARRPKAISASPSYSLLLIRDHEKLRWCKG